MKFEANIPIYLQIMEEIKRRIIIGEYKPGGKLPPVRELALSFGVNPNTVQRAFGELERDGLVYSERTSGRFIADDPEKIRGLRETVLVRKTDAFLEDMSRYGYDEESVLTYINSRKKV